MRAAKDRALAINPKLVCKRIGTPGDMGRPFRLMAYVVFGEGGVWVGQNPRQAAWAWQDALKKLQESK